MASDEGTWCWPCLYFLCNETHTQLSYIRGTILLNSNWALFDVQMSFRNSGGRESTPCWRGILPWEQHQLQIPLIRSLGVLGLDTLWFPEIQDSLQVPHPQLGIDVPSLCSLPCTKIPPVLVHLVLKSVTQSRELVQLKNTPKKIQGWRVGKVRWGRNALSPPRPQLRDFGFLESLSGWGFCCLAHHCLILQLNIIAE